MVTSRDHHPLPCRAAVYYGVQAMSEKAVLLETWGAAHFDPPPSLWTLRQMARSGKIQPQPIKIGKAYYVAPDARVVDPNRAPSLVDRLKAA
jgi:hypothetical protein